MQERIAICFFSRLSGIGRLAVSAWDSVPADRRKPEDPDDGSRLAQPSRRRSMLSLNGSKSRGRLAPGIDHVWECFHLPRSVELG